MNSRKIDTTDVDFATSCCEVDGFFRGMVLEGDDDDDCGGSSLLPLTDRANTAHLDESLVTPPVSEID